MNKYTEEDYKLKCEELNVDYIGFHKHKHKGAMIEFVCKKHTECIPYYERNNIENYLIDNNEIYKKLA